MSLKIDAKYLPLIKLNKNKELVVKNLLWGNAIVKLDLSDEITITIKHGLSKKDEELYKSFDEIKFNDQGEFVEGTKRPKPITKPAKSSTNTGSMVQMKNRF
jgi:hypothetical protein